MSRKPPVPRGLRTDVLLAKGNACAYCGGDAQVLDHVIPFSKDPVHLQSNLVPCCSLCNSIAGDKVFPNFEAKRRYILARRLERADQDQPRRSFRLAHPSARILDAAGEEPDKRRRVAVPLLTGDRLDPLRQRLADIANHSGWSGAAADLGLNRGTVWRFVCQGYMPKDAAIRAVLGLPPTVRGLYVGRGQGQSDVQIGVDAQLCCRCPEWFIPNHPRRRSCYLCRPSRPRRS